MSASTSLFTFITDGAFRESLEADYVEIQKCLEAQSWKAVHVLAGSLIETILIDYLVSQGIVPKQEALTLDLGRAIEKCKTAKILSQKSADLCSVIKAYRNLIHPGRVIRLKEQVSNETATVALSVMKIIVGEVSIKKFENYGYTAEQIVAKIERDSSAEAIIPHLLKETNRAELERLLLSNLPSRYLSAWEDEFAPIHLLGSLVACFRTAFDQIDETGKKKVAKRFVSILKEESDQAVKSYGTAFFRATDLAYLPETEVSLVKDHLLSRCKNDPSVHLLDSLSGIGGYLKEKEIVPYVDALVRVLTSRKPFAGHARKVLEAEYKNTSSNTDKKVANRLGQWMNMYKERGSNEKAELLEQLKLLYDEIPF